MQRQSSRKRRSVIISGLFVSILLGWIMYGATTGLCP